MSRLRIGFPLSRGGGGPTIFMGRLRQAIFEEKIAVTRYFFDPFADVLLCANAVRNPWRKPYVMRVDGIAFDSELVPNERMSRNAPIFSGIDRSAGVVYQSQFDLELVSSFHKSKKLPTIVIPNGVDLNKFRPDGKNMRASLGVSQDDLVFLSSAKWRVHKRLGSIIAAFESFCRTTSKNAHLLILGKLGTEPENVPPELDS
jgi:glycosyltransferase involved in cell wall biosynthesis